MGFIPPEFSAAAQQSSPYTPFLLSALITVIGVAVFFAISHYLPLRKTPYYVSIPVFVAVATSASAIVLVPLDVASTDDSHYPAFLTVSSAVLLVLWRTCYWVTFFLTWVILPGIGEYVDSGFHKTRDKVTYSLRMNMQYHLTVACVGLLMALYFFSAAGFHLASFKALIMAGSYAWGLLLACYLMGHGLVAFPRHYFRKASLSRRLSTLRREKRTVKAKFDEATKDLLDRVMTVRLLCQHRTDAHPDLVGWIDELKDKVDSLGVGSSATDTMNINIQVPLTKEYLASISRRLQLASDRAARYEIETARNEAAIRKIGAALEPMSSPSSSFPSGRGRIWFGLAQPVYNNRPLVDYYVLPSLSWAFALVLSFFSAMIVLSQAIAVFDPSVTPVAIITDRFRAHWLFPILMVHSALSAVSTLPRLPLGFWRSRTLTPGATAFEPAVWFASQVARLSIPLALNYSSLLPRDVYRDMVFYHFLGEKVDLTPFGGAFARYAPPAVVLFAVVVTLGGTYGWIGSLVRSKRTAGDAGNDEDHDHDNEGGERYGRYTDHPSGLADTIGLTDTPPSSRVGRSNRPPSVATATDQLWRGYTSFHDNGTGSPNTPTAGGPAFLSNGGTPARNGTGIVPDVLTNPLGLVSGIGRLGSQFVNAISGNGGRNDSTEDHDQFDIHASARAARAEHRTLPTGSRHRDGYRSIGDSRSSVDETGEPTWIAEFGHRVWNTIETSRWNPFAGGQDGSIRLEADAGRQGQGWFPWSRRDDGSAQSSPIGW